MPLRPITQQEKDRLAKIAREWDQPLVAPRAVPKLEKKKKGRPPKGE